MLARTIPSFALFACTLLGAACGGQTHGVAATTSDGAAPIGQDSSIPAETGVDAPAEAPPVTPTDGGGDSAVDATIADGGTEADAPGGLCGVICASDQDCFNGCPPAFETAYCCDLATQQCFIGLDGLSCPLHPNAPDSGLAGCLATGCAPDEMCVTYDSLDPPEEPIPSCFALPAACDADPSCACLAEAGVCQGGSILTPCGGADAGPAITCFF